MSDSEAIFKAFRNWLPKEAASFGSLVSRHGQLLKNVGQFGGVGAAVGALGGAGYGARQGYTEARERGEGVGTSALSGALHGLGGAAKGGALGAAVGGVAGGVASKAINPSWLAQKDGVIGASARFGQRQVHGLTGVLSPKELEAVRGGAYGARQGHEAAQKALHEAWIKDPSTVGPSVEKAVKAKKGLEAAENVQNMGLTSVPGYLKAVKDEGARKVLGASLKDQIHNMHPGMAAMSLGLPALSVARAAAGKEPESGEGKGETVGKNVGMALGGLTGAAMPVVGSTVMGGALEHAGKFVGRGVDRLRGRKNTPTTLGPSPLEPAEGQHMPSERVMSPAAAGQQPDIGSVM
jgi:hypothetical protein